MCLTYCKQCRTATHLLPRVHTRPTVCFHRVPFAAASFWGLLLSVNDRCLACNCHHLNAYLHRKLISAYRNTHCLAPLPAHTVSNPCSAGPTLHFALLSAIFYAIYLHSQCPALSLHFPCTFPSPILATLCCLPHAINIAIFIFHIPVIYLLLVVMRYSWWCAALLPMACYTYVNVACMQMQCVVQHLVQIGKKTKIIIILTMELMWTDSYV